MAAGEKLLKGIFSFISILIAAILLIVPSHAAASTGPVNSNIDVSLLSGAATFSIPIEVPPGRNGIQPNLSLMYNSYRGNGWIGVGWDLDMGTIQRSTKFGVDYSARDFVMLRNGASSDLVERADWGPNYFGAKIEEAFSRYYLNPSTGGWEVTTKDGLIYYYGTDPGSRQDDPDDGSRVFKWCLDKVADSNGNYMIVKYEKEPDGPGTYQGQIYLDRIEYTGNKGSTPSNSVNFYLDPEDRQDPTVMYSTNFAVRTAKRLMTLEILSRGNLVKAYKLTYLESSSTARSLLEKVQQYGSDATVDELGTVAGGSTLPNIIFDWLTPLSALNTAENISYSYGMSIHHWRADERMLHTGDFNGDGITDILLQGKNSARGTFLLLADKSGGFSTVQDISNSYGMSINHWRADARILHTGDFNGDGNADILLQGRNSARGSFLLLADKSGGFSTVQNISNSYGMSINHWRADQRMLHTGDFDGDGITDILLQGLNSARGSFLLLADKSGGFSRVQNISNSYGMSINHWRADARILHAGDFNGDGKADILLQGRNSARGSFLLLADRSGGFSTVQDISNSYGMSINHWRADTRILHAGDFNGDGKTDVLLQGLNSARGTFLLLADGSGGFSTVNNISNSFGMTINHWRADARRLHTGDFNGDGKADILLQGVNSGQNSFILSADGNGGFSTVQSISSSYGMSISHWRADARMLHTGDFNGDGKADILMQGMNSGYDSYRLSSTPFPDHISFIKTGLGGSAYLDKFNLKYTSSSQYKNTLLPFIVHPVSSITVYDGLGNLSTTKYSYSGGLYDISTREFRGFETVTQKAAVGTMPEIWTETKFHQDEIYKGRQYRMDLKAPGQNGALFSRTTFTWDKTDLGPPGDKSAFVKLVEKRSVSYDGETVSVLENYLYDDSNGNLLETTISGPDAESVTTKFKYDIFGDWLWRKIRETVEGTVSGKVRETYYDYNYGTGNLIYKEYWLNTGANPRIEMTYDEYGNQESVTDARGHRTVTEYDTATHTYPVRITYPQTSGVSHVVENEVWDYRFGKVKVTKDENGNRTYYDYDEFGRLVQVDSPDGGQVITEYYDHEFPRLVITRSEEDGSGSTIDNYQYFDGLGRQIQTISFGEDAKSIVTRYYYDGMSRNDLVEGPFFAAGVGFPLEPLDLYPWTQTTFDKRGRPKTVENSDGEYGSVATTFSYSGLSSTVTDPDGGSKTEKKDYLGRAVQVIEHADNGDYDTNYIYNAAGDLLQVIDYYENTTTINYDSLGRKISMTDQDMGFWQYTYDQNGNLKTQTDQKQQTITFAYDELNRILSKSYTTSDPKVFHSYDNLNIPNGRGRLYSVSNSRVTTTHNAYDSMGRVESVSKTISGSSSAYTTRYSYDLAGKLKQTIYPDGYRVNNSYYPGTGLLESVTGSDNVRYVHNSGYEPTGKIGLLEHGNGSFTRHTYDPESTRLESIISSRAGPTTDLQNKAYQYTPAGNIKQVADHVKGISYNYIYDKLHRLKTEANTGSYDPISYNYDALGNIMSKTVGSAVMAYDYVGLRPHAVKRIRFNGTSYNYTYDANGNTIVGPDFTDPQQVAVRTISYNADNMPRSISHTKGGNTVITDFVYDGSGGRAKKTVQGSSTTYYIGEHYEVKNGVATKFIFAGNLRVAKIAGTNINYFHKDHLGSSTVISDNRGNAIETADYTPFGSLRDHAGTNASNYKFTDQEFDPSSGLYNYNARLYDPVIGRFISPDPYVQAPFDPQTLNRYTYVRNNPLVYIDPSGYSWIGKAWKKVKKFANRTVKAAASVFTANMLTHAVFSVFDVAVPGLGQAIALATNYAIEQLSDAFKGGSGGSIGAPSFAESLIPVWGSARAAINDFQQGRYIWGSVNTLIAATDVFLVKSIVTGIAKISTRAALKVSFKVVPKRRVRIALDKGLDAVGEWRPGSTDIFINRGAVRQSANAAGRTVAEELQITAYHEAFHRGFYKIDNAVSKIAGVDDIYAASMQAMEAGIGRGRWFRFEEWAAETYGKTRMLLRQRFGIK